MNAMRQGTQSGYVMNVFINFLSTNSYIYSSDSIADGFDSKVLFCICAQRRRRVLLLVLFVYAELINDISETIKVTKYYSHDF